MSSGKGRKRYSLSRRMLATQSLVIIVFVAVTVLSLEQAFRNTATAAARERLDLHLLTILAVAELDPEGRLSMPRGLPEPRLDNPAGGLYAEIHDAEGDLLWRSASAVGMALPEPALLVPGERNFRREQAAGEPVFQRSLGVSWERLDGRSRHLIFTVSESMEGYLAQLARWRRQLSMWFGAAAALLMAVQVLSLRRMLRPLRRVEAEIRDVESGRRENLSEDYPAELAGVAENLNALVESERHRARRYRETLDNLAHSLKTPLAAVRAALGGTSLAPDSRTLLEDQVDAVDRIVAYQLRRAATAGERRIGRATVPVGPVARRVRTALARVYDTRGLRIEEDIDDDAVFAGDEGDLMEILGNVLDNACKYAEGRVRLRARDLTVGDDRQLELEIADDGSGIPAHQADAALTRGTRLDESRPGEGIGLAVVKELVGAVGGEVSIGVSDLGGAAIRIRVPVP